MSTPYDSTLELIKNTCSPINQEKYAQIIGSLVYLTTRTRLDISYAISRLSRYTNNQSILHWIALERVFEYLKSTIDYGLNYVGYPAVLERYTDANWISDSLDIKQHLVLFFFLVVQLFLGSPLNKS